MLYIFLLLLSLLTTRTLFTFIVFGSTFSLFFFVDDEFLLECLLLSDSLMVILLLFDA